MIISTLTQFLLTWYADNKRKMPWRGLKEPYLIWLSEVILQQTRVEQGLPYFLRFKEKFPRVHDIAQASESEVLKMWEGLGYYSRARNVHKAAKMVSQEYEGVFPDNYSDLLNLPGVGPYTASAIASICYEEKVAVVDGNVNRFIARLFGIDLPVDSASGKKLILEKAQTLLDAAPSAGDFNQAMMEFGSLYCTPKSPDCGNCVFLSSCIAASQKTVEQLPIKKAKVKVKHRFFDYHVIIDEGHTYIRQRVSDGIWKGLYEFILIETEVGPETNVESLSEEGHPIEQISSYKHILSHQHIHARFITYDGKPATNKDGLLKVKIDNLRDYPMARLTTRFLEEHPIE